MNRSLMYTAINDVVGERERQETKWGEQSHPDVAWATILGEEFGEVCKEALAIHYENCLTIQEGASERLRAELVQVAAVAVAWIEDIDRNKS